MALLLIQHARQELLDQHEVRDKVDFEDFVEEHAGGIEDGFSGA